VWIERWGGAAPLEARVRRVEPAGFLKVSALGIEEQRVNVIADFTTPLVERRSLGDGFRVEARVVVWEAQQVLKVPAGALFRHENNWVTFRVSRGRAEWTSVTVGETNGLETEILSGLSVGDVVIVHPSDRVAHGTRVNPSP
jgi:HlyD family secretion protein